MPDTTALSPKPGPTDKHLLGRAVEAYELLLQKVHGETRPCVFNHAGECMIHEWNSGNKDEPCGVTRARNLLEGLGFRLHLRPVTGSGPPDYVAHFCIPAVSLELALTPTERGTIADLVFSGGLPNDFTECPVSTLIALGLNHDDALSWREPVCDAEFDAAWAEFAQHQDEVLDEDDLPAWRAVAVIGAAYLHGRQPTTAEVLDLATRGIDDGRALLHTDEGRRLFGAYASLAGDEVPGGMHTDAWRAPRPARGTPLHTVLLGLNFDPLVPDGQIAALVAELQQRYRSVGMAETEARDAALTVAATHTGPLPKDGWVITALAARLGVEVEEIDNLVQVVTMPEPAQRQTRIQPAAMSDSPAAKVPYPFYVLADGSIGRQDFWRGNPAALTGFRTGNHNEGVVLRLEQFLAYPHQAIGMFPVFTDQDGQLHTQDVPIASVGFTALPTAT